MHTCLLQLYSYILHYVSTAVKTCNQYFLPCATLLYICSAVQLWLHLQKVLVHVYKLRRRYSACDWVLQLKQLNRIIENKVTSCRDLLQVTHVHTYTTNRHRICQFVVGLLTKLQLKQLNRIIENKVVHCKNVLQIIHTTNRHKIWTHL